MKPVRVYHVEVMHELVPEGRDRIEMQSYRMSQPHVVTDTSKGPVLIEDVRSRVYPIQEFCEVADGEPNPMLRCDPFELPPVERAYIALDPELERLMAIKYQGKIDNLLYARAQLEEELSGALAQKHALSDRMACWQAMPWYRRVWSALKGEK